MFKNILALCVFVVCCIVIGLNSCTDRGIFQSLRWPPDTIKAVRAWGNIYDVTSSPVAIDPRMKIILIWPPDTITEGGINLNPELMLTEGEAEGKMLKSSNIIAKSAIWPPDTTNYPEQIIMIWPPDTTQ